MRLPRRRSTVARVHPEWIVVADGPREVACRIDVQFRVERGCHPADRISDAFAQAADVGVADLGKTHTFAFFGSGNSFISVNTSSAALKLSTAAGNPQYVMHW